MASHTPAAYPDRLVEYLFSAMMISWGLWLLNPAWSTFGNPQYAALASLASEASWGAFSISVGVVRTGALLINGRYAGRRSCAFSGHPSA